MRRGFDRALLLTMLISVVGCGGGTEGSNKPEISERLAELERLREELRNAEEIEVMSVEELDALPQADKQQILIGFLNLCIGTANASIAAADVATACYSDLSGRSDWTAADFEECEEKNQAAEALHALNEACNQSIKPRDG